MDQSGLRRRYYARREECARLTARLRVMRGRLSGGCPGGDARPTITPLYRREAETRPEPGPDFAAEVEGLEESTLAVALEEGERLLTSMREGLEEMRADLRSTREWETFNSGRETRDVLQNGERRAHMEARYGREVRLGDVDYEKGLPWEKRRELTMEGALAAGPAEFFLPAEPVGPAASTGTRLPPLQDALPPS